VKVHLNRALSKLGILTRSQATRAILDGRVSVDGRVVRDPAARVDSARARIAVDGNERRRTPWRTLLLHKPRGVLTTRRDPAGRPTVYDVVGTDANGLVPVGRLDAATTGLLLLTTDTGLAAWLTDPANQVPRLYAVTVRGRIAPDACTTLERGVRDRGETLKAASVVLRKASARESHLVVELREGKNREMRRLFKALGHEVTRLKRVRFGGLALGTLAPGKWRAIDEAELHGTFPQFRAATVRKV
jgi:23S rRNA pseudouridine2605 synthase